MSMHTKYCGRKWKKSQAMIKIMINLQKASVKRRLLLKDASITVQFSLINQKESHSFPYLKRMNVQIFQKFTG